ncbi:protein FAR1-RELATED SEQUENCE [Citrus sinensis]|nr:protein FAR1-RELATED SEQUENCE [Citrus sinensis]KAH9724271.1 protein FAR1-RELATED SEQUENCE [Citrus sinensis]
MRQDTAVAVSVHNNGAASLDGAISDDSLSLAACTFNSTSSNQFESLLPNSEANTQPLNSDRTFSSYASGDRLFESDVIGRVFSSIEEAETFYFDYAKSIGFSVRKNIMRTNVQGQVTVRRWVCSKEGKRSKKYLEIPDRKKTARPLTRELCRAAFRIRFDHRKGVWVACEWVDTHTHVLVPAVQVQFLRSTRQVSDVDYATASTMYLFGMKPSRIHELMAKCSGGYENVGFTRNDLSNRLYEGRREQMLQTDSETFISLLRGKQDMDPGFYYQYTIDSEGRLSDTFWCDSGMRADFHYFGDVLSFDSTYRTNAYNKPLVLFVGLNHHMRSTVFGFALLSSETEEKYIWLLRTFLSAMDGKMPVSIVTDGDRAMRNAIRTVFPDASHRLCCWHLERNATANISDPNFTSAFKDVMLNYMVDDEFQFKWDQMIGKFHLTNNEWIKKLYADRHMWAETFLRHKFFGGLRSNQRCESMNAYINQYVGGKLMLFEFVMQMEFLISRLRYKEAEDDHRSCHTMPVLITHLQKHYEQQAATIYTRTVFNRVLKELREDGLLYISNCMSDVGRRIYVIKKFKLEDRSWRVVFHEADSKIVCTCHLMQSLGIPCSHSFTVMKAENLSEIPKCMILPRWTKNSKIAQSYLQHFSSKPSMNEAARIGSLTIACRNLIHFAAKTVDRYNDAIQVIHGLTLQAQDVLNTDAFPRASTKGRHVDIIKDPLIIKTKGSTKTTKASVKKRLCGTCQQPGHTKRTCIQYGRVKANCDTDNASLCTDFVSENTFNTTIATTTATLDMSTWGDDISIGTASTEVDHNESFVLPVLNRCDGQSSNDFTFPSQDLSQNNRGGTISPQWHEWWHYNVR